jgi:hypothetical protein
MSSDDFRTFFSRMTELLPGVIGDQIAAFFWQYGWKSRYSEPKDLFLASQFSRALYKKRFSKGWLRPSSWQPRTRSWLATRLNHLEKGRIR